MSRLLSSDVSVLSTASIRVSRSATVPGSPDRFWAVLAEDPSAWGKWCPGFSETSGWVTPGAPGGVGRQRLMHAFGMTFLETVLEWTPSERFTFAIDECVVPGLRRFVESWSLRSVEVAGAPATEATWTMATDTSMPDFILRRYLAAQQTIMMAIAKRRLEKLFGD